MTRALPTIPGDLVSMLDVLAQTIVDALGFGVTAVNLVRPDGTFEVVSVAGNDQARDLLLGTVESAQAWEEILAASETWGRLHFLDHSRHPETVAMLLWKSDVAALDTERAWHPEDALFALLTAEDGSRLGILSVDVPSDGLRPDRTTRNALEAFAVCAALAIEHATMRSRAEASELAFKIQATHDPLTGLGNRSMLLDRLHHALTSRQGSGSVMALVFVDLDEFKSINDKHSHTAGDHVLRAVAHRVRNVVRPHDTVARWGGDEFLILLDPTPDDETATRIVRRILEAVAEPTRYLGQDLAVTASIGVAFWSAGDAVDADDLIRQADAAMYQVKGSERDGYAVFGAADRTWSPDAG